jgi:hypothetical protein
MGQRDKFELDYEDIPFVFETAFGNQNIYIGINYNEVGNFYTVDLFDSDYQPVIMGEQLVYGKCLWRHSIDSRVPAVDLIPLDESGKDTEITPETFGKTIFLYLDGPDEESEEDDTDG